MQVDFRRFLLTIAAMLLVGGAAPAAAEDGAFLGSWRIDKAVVAPWADTAVKPDDTEMKSLLGKTITFKKENVVGPGILACKGPTYELTEGGADMLFQGALTQKTDGSEQDPKPVAAALGFHGSRIKTLQTGCENEIDFHFVDNDTVEFGLNDYIYGLKRQGN